MKTLDVFCDGVDDGRPCQAWIGGVTGGRAPEARARARLYGWVRRDGRDLCPECADLDLQPETP